MTREKQTSDRLRRVVTRKALQVLAGGRYFDRGEVYFLEGRVRSLQERKGVVQATVNGTRPYKVRIWAEKGELVGTCDCPLGRGGSFCKHIVATGLAWIDSQARQTRLPDLEKGTKAHSPQPDITSSDIEEWLQQKSSKDLVAIIMDHADENAEFYDSLKMRVATGAETVNTVALRAVIRDTIDIDGFIPYSETYTYSRGVDRIARQLRELLNSGEQTPALTLTEYAIELVEKQLEQIDDSDGSLGMVIEDLMALHLDACRAAKPDPKSLAEKLFDNEINDPWGFWNDSYERYAAILKKEGKKAFRQLAEEAWEQLPHLKPGEKDPDSYGRRWTLTKMVKGFAEKDGDFERVVEVMSSDLSDSHDFLAIAERCREAKKYALAREWAEKGLEAFSDQPDSRLRKFLAEEYVRAKRQDKAVTLLWENFVDRSILTTYQDLLKYAEKANQKSPWREKALKWIRDDLARRRKEAKRSQSRWSWGLVDHSLLVEIFLWEEKLADAWKEAQTGGCSDSLWLRLAKEREAEYPADAVPIYQRLVEQEIQKKNNQSYQEAVDMIGHIRKLLFKMGKENEFRQYLAEIKKQHKRKRNFIGYLARKEW
ncbi:MAG TPA: hypothetical protein ENH11_00965 [Candidatus Acetothermia bacterium]|nr:hypothetical protein [Candidatus Acetothermia bacterium]